MADFPVSTSAEIVTALGSAVGGDTITLADGNYANLAISGHNFTSYVTIQAANPLGALFLDASVDIANSSYVRLVGLEIRRDTAGSTTARLIDIDTCSNIDIDGFKIHCTAAGDKSYSGVWMDSSTTSDNVTIQNSTFSDLYRGIACYKATNFTAMGNTFAYIGEDAMKFSTIDGFTIQDNLAHSWRRRGTAHCDFIQFEGTGTKANGLIRRNQLYVGDDTSFAGVQGILANSQTHQNVTVEDNIFYTGNINGIQYNSGSTGMIVRRNSVIFCPNLYSHSSTQISAPGTRENNLSTTNVAGSTSGTNITMNVDDPTDPLYYEDLITNPTVGYNATVNDLLPIAGTVAEGKGAWAFMQELIGAPAAPLPALLTVSVTVG